MLPNSHGVTVQGSTQNASMFHVNYLVKKRTAFKAVFKKKSIKVSVSVNGTHGAQRAIMTLDPEKLQADTEQFLRDMATCRAVNDASGTVGYYVDSKP